jgi:flavin-dependent dehydrogenase
MGEERSPFLGSGEVANRAADQFVPPVRPPDQPRAAEICVGDAITMIPPITGNGMSMAFASAELAVAPLVAWSRGELLWHEARDIIARDCDAAFARRLSCRRCKTRSSCWPPAAIASGGWRLSTHVDSDFRFQHGR